MSKNNFPSKSLVDSIKSTTFAPTRTRQASSQCLNRRVVLFSYGTLFKDLHIACSFDGIATVARSPRRECHTDEQVPRHPAQLYEALAYLLIFAIGISLYQYWRKSQHMRTTSPIAVGSGFYFGYCIMTIFTFRFFVEFLKKEQVDFEQGMLLDMGQLLSIPFVFVGLWCMIKK